jgi:hypothetical protein
MAIDYVKDNAKDLKILFSILSDEEIKEIIESAGVHFTEPESAKRIDYLNVADEADPAVLKRLYLKKIEAKLDNAIEELKES